jgi:hypothetical protein
MDFSKATNQQLYEIAMNDFYRLIERYEAAKELQRRRKVKQNEISRNRPQY